MVVAPPKTAPRLFLIDAYALIYRSFFAFINRPLTNSKGQNTSAAWGFINFLLDIRDDFAPDYLAVVFDAGTSHRADWYPEYKATREKMPEDLAESLPGIRNLVEAFHDPIVSVEGFEADDVIGTLAAQALDRGLEAIIVSGDKDFYQLVGPGVHLLNPGRGGAAGVAPEWVDESNADAKFGVPPERVVDYLALIGDSSDNVPGAPGIGPKTAVQLIGEYGAVEDILDHAEEITGKRARESLLENADQVRLSKRLVTILKDVPIDLDLDELTVREPDEPRLRELLVELEFRTLLERFAPAQGDLVTREEEGADTDYRLVLDPEAVADILGRARERGEVALRVLTAEADPMRGRIAGIVLSTDPGEAHYLPFGHQPPSELTLEAPADDAVLNLPPLDSDPMAPLRALLADPDVRKIGHDLKHAVVSLAENGIELASPWFDTMIASYVLDPGRRGRELESLATDLLGIRTTPYKELVGTGKKEIPFTRVLPEPASAYAGEWLDCVLRLRGSFQRGLEEQSLDRLFHDLEMPLLPVLARMERNGIRIDPVFFGEMSRRLGRELQLVQEEIFKEAGSTFNLNSTPQLREMLFDKLELPVLKRTKTGPSTDASVLEELATLGHTLPRLLLEYRQLEKLRNTYVDALPSLVHPRTRRIHTSFNQTVAATGRLSSSNPNLQNIPIRSDLGREVRKGFLASPGRVLLAADYSQIELRILAHFSGDEAFVTAFNKAIDVHKQTAAVIFDAPIEDVTPRMRAQAKTINFATIYGQGDFSLARQLGISREEARRFIEQYFERFSGVRAFLDEQIAMAKERGYVETLSGRRRYVPELRSKNWNIRSFGERVAQNTPIQGTAADMIKKAMIDIHAALEEVGGGAMMLLQVHDELVLEVPPEELAAVRDLVVTHMEGAMTLDVPLVVDTGVGESWFDTKC